VRPPPPFSIVVVARNEATRLPGLLEHLQVFQRRGGEVLVMDTGSTDETPRLARAAGCRVEDAAGRFHFTLSAAHARRIQRRFGRGGEGPLCAAGERVFDFGRARQHAALLARHDHVLLLDASDRLEAFDLRFLSDAIRAGRASRFGYGMRLGDVRYRVVRFYDRRRETWKGRVHEVLYPTRPGTDRGTTIECTDDQLLVRHDRNDATVRAYAAGLAFDVMEFPDNPRWRYYLGCELFSLELFHSALAVLDEHAALPEGWSAERGSALCVAGQCLEGLGRLGEAADRYARAFAIDSARREPLLRLAELCRRRGDFQGATAHATAALSIPRTSPFAEPERHFSYGPHEYLYWGLHGLGRIEEARAHWRKCRRLAPTVRQFRDDERLFAAAGRTARPRPAR
jgi:glycosyltransferase involved in cell wall biosynthesis